MQGFYYCPFLLLFDGGFVSPDRSLRVFYCFDTVLSLFEEIPSAGFYYCPFLLLFDYGFVRPDRSLQFFYASIPHFRSSKRYRVLGFTVVLFYYGGKASA